MSKAIDNTAIIYQLAYKLGAKVEVLDAKTNKWSSISNWTGITSETEYRVHPTDENVLKAAKKVFKSLHTEVIFKDYKYQVPNNAMDGKTPVLFIYGFGVYATVDQSGLVTETPKETADLADTSENVIVYVAHSNKTVFGKKRKKD